VDLNVWYLRGGWGRLAVCKSILEKKEKAQPPQSRKKYGGRRRTKTLLLQKWVVVAGDEGLNSYGPKV